MYKEHLFDVSSICYNNNARLSILSFCYTLAFGVTRETTAAGLGICGLISVERYCGFMFMLKHTAMFRVITADGAVCVL